MNPICADRTKKLLLITPNDILADRGGLSIYTRQFLSAVEGLCEVRVICLCAKKQEKTSHQFTKEIKVDYLNFLRRKLIARFLSILSSYPSYYFEYQQSKILREIKETISEYSPDTIIVNHRRTAWLTDKLVISSQDIELVYINHNYEKASIESLANYYRNPLIKIFIQIEAWKTGLAEKNAISRCAKTSFISGEDRANYMIPSNEYHYPVIPIYIDGIDKKQPVVNHKNKNILFVGSADWLPKSENIIWLTNTIFPKVLQKHPHSRLVLAGYHVSTVRSRINTNLLRSIDFHESPAELSQLYKQARVFIVPEQQHGGVKIKTVEAAAYGMAIVSTPAGISGTSLENGKSVLVGNNETELANQLCTLLDCHKLIEKISENAVNQIKLNFNRRKISDRWKNLVGLTDNDV